MAGRGNPQWKKGQSGNPGGRKRTSAAVYEATMKLRDVAAAEVPAAFERLKALATSRDEKVSLAANKEIITLGTDRAVLEENKMQALQQRKLEAECKILERNAAGDNKPAVTPEQEQEQLDALRARYPELVNLSSNGTHEDA